VKTAGGTYENQRDAEVFIASPDVVSVVFCRRSPVYRVEVETVVVVLDILWACSEGALDATPGPQVNNRSNLARRTTHFGMVCKGGNSVSTFPPSSSMIRPTGFDVVGGGEGGVSRAGVDAVVVESWEIDPGGGRVKILSNDPTPKRAAVWGGHSSRWEGPKKDYPSLTSPGSTCFPCAPVVTPGMQRVAGIRFWALEAVKLGGARWIPAHKLNRCTAREAAGA